MDKLSYLDNVNYVTDIVMRFDMLKTLPISNTPGQILQTAISIPDFNNARHYCLIIIRFAEYGYHTLVTSIMFISYFRFLVPCMAGYEHT